MRLDLGKPTAVRNSKEQKRSYSPLHSGEDYSEKSWNSAKWYSWENLKAGISIWSSSHQNPKFWKPVTLRAPVLGAVILASIGIIITLESLAHTASLEGNGGGIVFAETVEKISMGIRFSYLLLPTILAVFFSILWSWVDLDSKRLEPWFQLSKVEGALGSDSLLLQYPFDFLPFIPITAFRRKHWGVFFSSTVILIIFWIITPLQSAIFNASTITRSRSTTMQISAKLMPLETQQNILNANFLNTAYGISSLGQKPPPFTTPEFALLPFKPSADTKLKSDTQTWSAVTKIYSTSLDCEPALISQGERLTRVFDNGRGCKTSLYFQIDSTASVLLLYLGYFNDAVVDWSIGNPNCTKEHEDNFLAVWAPRVANETLLVDYENMTALFCRPKYHVQEAMVTVNASDGRVASHKTIGDRQQLPTPNNLFNTTHFEYVVSTGVPPVRHKANHPDTYRLEPYPSVAKYNLSWPMPNAVGFGVEMNEGTVQDLKDPDLLRKAFERAHMLLFSVAFNIVTMPVDSAAIAESRTGTVQDTLGAIIMERTISVIVEAAFGVVIAMTIALWYLTYCRPSRLLKDPATISEVMSLVQDFNSKQSLTEIASQKFRLTIIGTGNQEQVYLTRDKAGSSISSTDTKDSALTREESIDQQLPVIQPSELRLTFGFLFMSTISVALGAVIFLEIYSTKRNGIALPSTNSTVMSIIENYLPTVFATLLEPAWIILNRILCLLQPFEELRKGHANASRSIKAKYTSRPPQLAIWRALRSGHFILAAVCVIAVSTNLLAVALSGLFEQRSTAVTFPLTGTQSRNAKFKEGRLIGNIGNAVYLDHFYAAQSNITSGTSLPPWVDTARVYVPFEFETPRIETAAGTLLGLEGIIGSTTGIGAELSCFELSADPDADNSFSFGPSNDSSSVIFTTSHLLPNGTRATCIRSSNGGNSAEVDSGNVTSGASAFEIVDGGQGSNNDGFFCSNLILAGWFRLGAEDSTSDSVFGNRALSHRMIACKPQLKVAEFDVLVTTEGRILNSTQTSNFTPAENLSQYFTNATRNDTLVNESGFRVFNARIYGADSLFGEISLRTLSLGAEAEEWHNNSFTCDWTNSLIMYKMGNDSIVNPNSPVPSYEDGKALFSETYTLLFALLLGLNLHVFEDNPDAKLGNLEVTLLATEQRIFLEPIMFKITAILLAIQLMVAILYYTCRPKMFLNSLPTSIASIVGFVQFSRALDDFVPGKIGSKGKEEGDGEKRYGFGRFVGTDGKTHVGIEGSRWVVPLESENPEAGKGGWWSGLRLRRRRKGGEVDAWI